MARPRAGQGAAVALERQHADDLPGVQVTPEEQPELWSLVRCLADEVGTRPPDEIRLTGDVNAGVSEETRLLGLRVSRRRMFSGTPLLAGLTEAQLISVRAHELGHYANRDTRLAAAYCGRRVMARTVAQLATGRWFELALAKLFTYYANLYLAVSSAVCRKQELAADAVSVQVVGQDVAASALREVHVVDAAWDLFMARYATVAWDAGYLPGRIVDGFSALLTDPKPGEQLDRIRQDPARRRDIPLRLTPALHHAPGRDRGTSRGTGLRRGCSLRQGARP
ncbi:hypothetical protein GCM10012275_18340 [Longimycelium tulufanense]|uniref:Peptidase M48 domain-containing protein n=1 Tax=Longimycelium tulufanense TaxID=907463 RepID=A0A8J3C778_9PSEU|nr:M48 family metallopeptidase [Longimycelium tulufanense]GGM47597.1 hypothetical protein GCM10012275_18340 [Longimycelium tulufanense]